LRGKQPGTLATATGTAIVVGTAMNTTADAATAIVESFVQSISRNPSTTWASLTYRR
jgi:F0F1-type ATP synthase membrane subunit c/vacuolar-type H+-ATPase subunit K